MKPVKHDKLEEDMYYLSYRSSNMIHKEIEIIQFLGYDDSWKHILRYRMVKGSQGLEIGYGLERQHLKVSSFQRVTEQDECNRIKIFQGMLIEFFELEAHELIDFI